MLIHFNILYATRFGESLRVVLPDGEFIDLEYHEGSVWKGYYETPGSNLHLKVVLESSKHEQVFLGQYDIKSSGDTELFLEPSPLKNDIFKTKAFNSLFKGRKKEKRLVRDGKITFSLRCDPPGKGLVPCITGSAQVLGAWKEKKAVPMKASGNEWICRFDITGFDQETEYKFGLYDTKKERLVEYEEGDNRKLEEVTATTLVQSAADFKRKWKGAGINIPVSAIRTEKSWGCGDFSSLRELVDLASSAGFSMVQLLPLNDTIAGFTDKDSYPYSAISSFALHPMYLDVQKLAKAKDIRFGEDTIIRIKHLNDLQQMDYSGVVALKLAALKVIFEKDQDDFRDDFNWFQFFDINREWLLPYAAFCYLRDKNGTADYSAWGVFSTYDEDLLQELASPGSEAYPEILFYYFIQYHLHLQLQDAAEYAHGKGVILKGDLPIGVGRFSADTWTKPHLFNLDKRAGAPPDYFTADGQDWGFPTYNWDAMKQDGYSWWPRRLEVMERFYDALRIDHVIGLMRIWTIPAKSKTAASGYYVPALALSSADFEVADPSIDPELLAGDGNADAILIRDEREGHYHFRFNMQSVDMFRSLPASQQQSLERLYHYYYGSMQQQLWRERGHEHLSLLKQSTSMLLCAEDLGFVPPVTESLLDSLQILSLWVQRMSRDAAHSYSDLSKAPYLSVVTPSTHDMPVLQEWWESEHTSRDHFFEKVLHSEGEAPSVFTAEVATNIICQHLESPAMWAVFLLQDLLSCSEDHSTDGKSQRINDPANSSHVWNYRLPVTCSSLSADKKFISLLKKLIRNAGR